MLCSKFKIAGALALLAATTFAQNSQEPKQEPRVKRFTSKECLMAEYETTVAYKGELFGLMENSLLVKKEVCEITVLNKGFFDTSWKIDVCREPIHMKVTLRGTLDVYKRKGECQTTTESEYCDFWKKLKSAIEDHGLIFAQGEREKLSTSHGKIYCAYLLLNKHLGEGVLFSKFQDPINLYKDSSYLNEEEIKTTPETAAPVSPNTPSDPQGEDLNEVEAQGRF